MASDNRKNPAIVLNPPPLNLSQSGKPYWTVSKYVPSDGYITVEEALKQPAANGFTEDQLRDAIVAGRVQGPDGKPIRSINGFFNDWILPADFKVMKAGTKIPILPPLQK